MTWATPWSSSFITRTYGGPEWDGSRDRPTSARAGLLWGLLRVARVLYRNSPVGVVLRMPDGSERTARRGEPSVTVVGCPEELTLHAFGRDHAIVDIEGDQVAVAAVQSSQRGL